MGDLWSKALIERIDDTCRGHVVWVHQALEILGEHEQFQGNYWANGTQIGGTDKSRDLTATAFQILKAKSWLPDQDQRYPSDNDMRTWESFMKHSERWFKALQKDDKREQYVFARFEESETAHYHIHDHVWIWNAMRAVESTVHLQSSFYQRHTTFEASVTLQKLVWDGVSKEARTSILKRFTTEGAPSQRRTLATSRTVWKSRFLSHSRDTALFYKDWSFFDSRSKPSKPWINTADVQTLHEENDDSKWRNPLRHGLALIMARQNLKINSKRVEEMFSRSKSILLRSCSPNGLFAGYLNLEKEPDIFPTEDSRDNNWHVTFELPYLMWIYGREVPNQAKPQASQGNGLADESVISKFVPFKNLSEQQTLLDQRHIVEFSDEWLYKCPEFLEYDPDISGDKLKEKITEFGREHRLETALAKATLRTASRGSLPSFGGDVIRGLVADIPKSKRGLQNQKNNKGALSQLKQSKRPFKHVLNKNLLDNLVHWRTADEGLVKRRLIWLPLADEDTALLCCLAAPPSEQEDLLAFFDSHATFEKKFLDDTTAVTNTWTTEFHLSFYQLHKAEPLNISKRNGSEPSLIPLRRGTMGFRFNGDFFDRYWTCHVVERNCKGDQELRSGFENLSTDIHEHERREQALKERREQFETREEYRKKCEEEREVRERDRHRRQEERKKREDERQRHEKETRGGIDCGIVGEERRMNNEELQRDEEEEMEDERESKEDKDQTKVDEEQRMEEMKEMMEVHIKRWESGRGVHQMDGDSIIEKFTRKWFFGRNSDEASCQRKLLELIVKNTSEPWHQRKVLELILFHEMTEQVAICMEEILQTLRGVLVKIKNESTKVNDESSKANYESIKSGTTKNCGDPKPAAPSDALSDILSEALFFDKIDSGSYFSFTEKWEELQQILQVLDDDLEETLDKILSWESREKDRGSEKPRWTTKDEKKYRSALTKLTRSNAQNVRRLQRLRANARSLRSALLNTRNYIREELNLRGAEDTRYFTYVTVVFLPLGFATGIFSTSGTPSGLTAVWIVVAAVVALLLTGLALHFDQQIATLKHRLEDRFPWLMKPGRSTGQTPGTNIAGDDWVTDFVKHALRSPVSEQRTLWKRTIAEQSRV